MLRLTLWNTCLCLLLNTAIASIGGDKWVSQPGSTDFVLKEKLISLTGDSFYVKNYETGATVINANAAMFSFRDSIQLLDAETGEELFTIKSALFKWLPTYYIMKGGETLATVRKNRFSLHKTTLIYEGEAKFNPITNTADSKILMTMKGGLLLQRDTTFYKGTSDEKVAWAHENLFAVGSLFGQDDYGIHVEEGNDAALVLAAVICKDQIEEAAEEKEKEEHQAGEEEAAEALAEKKMLDGEEL